MKYCRSQRSVVGPNQCRRGREALQPGFPSRDISALLFLTAVAITCSSLTADAHSAPAGWVYPIQCCSDKDCEPVHDANVVESPEGYLVRDSGETIGYGDARIKQSPDDEFHLCRTKSKPPSPTICLFVPPRSF
ncbi:Hypothetical protein NGAL_HAMBI1189_40700 [Neorhizobium galegae bv. officinalis]|uniref:Uncharacterized protein n=1 Tax=Neorhizobium galegae bv. officinalis TaxID=323656 RepID=A0A0T7GWK4_NEOGA|nr:Hypothetical protein NGAL_HAMBI1189_40700 [Neorhizobium galegae bv. officinalis]